MVGKSKRCTQKNTQLVKETQLAPDLSATNRLLPLLFVKQQANLGRSEQGQK